MDLFGADPIPLSRITAIEQDSADLIVWAIPAMAFFTFLEAWYSWKENRKSYHTKEAFGSLFVGLGNVAINLFFKVALIYGAVAIYNLVPWRMELNWWTIIPCLVIYDFCSYWAHRVSHFNRFFWATHVVHHTAEYYNLTVSFRLSWMQHFKILFFLPLAFAGFHPVILFIVNQIGVLFQFWQHTEYIGKLPKPIEWLIVTPSNHRVHHGSDEKYLDKNFGVIFIVWDRLLGTYHPEEERPTYGITTPIAEKLNPLYLNFHEYGDMIRDVRSARGMRQKLFYLFGSPSAIAREKKGSGRQELGIRN
ncbi:MAG TPA: sterol desaturase family protein [Chitinophagaceae bacterium]|nr:sterol desaturase family protein [Chitinophagaceae bacterium]